MLEDWNPLLLHHYMVGQWTAIVLSPARLTMSCSWRYSNRMHGNRLGRHLLVPVDRWRMISWSALGFKVMGQQNLKCSSYVSCIRIFLKPTSIFHMVDIKTFKFRNQEDFLQVLQMLPGCAMDWRFEVRDHPCEL